MTELISDEEILSRIRGRGETRPDCLKTHVDELEVRNRMLVALVKDLRAQLRAARRPVYVRRAA